MTKPQPEINPNRDLFPRTAVATRRPANTAHAICPTMTLESITKQSAAILGWIVGYPAMQNLVLALLTARNDLGDQHFRRFRRCKALRA